MTSAQQRTKALKSANRIRLGRAKARRAISEGKLSVLDALALPCCATASLHSLLLAQRRWGEIKVAKFLRDLAYAGAPIAANRPVVQLTDREKRVLGSVLESSGAGR